MGADISGALTASFIAVAVLQLTGDPRMSRTPPSVDAKASKTGKSPDLLDLLASGDPPAFANDQNHRIIFWNKGAERLMERTAAQALGRLCHEIFCGRDPFGNRFCNETCTVDSAIARHETVSRFEIVTGERARMKSIGMTVVEIPGPRPGTFTAVHIMDQIDEKSRLARELARLREFTTAPPHSAPAKDGSVPVSLHLSPSNAAGPAPDLDPTVTEQLSERELDVLRAIAAGLANKDIANSLHISVATTRNHVQHILKKLNVHSKLEAVALAFRNGWA
jgi:DNA-binding CsgD family transcriptional regulator